MKTNNTSPRQRITKRRALIGVIVLIVILTIGLLADLAGRGLVWQQLWYLTGEEEPLAQVRGFAEWLGNFTRRMPDLRPDIVPELAQVNPYGINTFLQNEVDPEKRERQAQMIAEAGFRWIRQEFPWEDIEIHERGDFIDRRNDPEGVDAWAKYDHIVDVAEEYDLEIQTRLSNPPNWSRAAGEEAGAFAPPDDFDDFVNYAVAVAERYQGRIHYYQIWNEPNIFPEWGNNPVDPVAYVDLLCRTYDALKTVDPEIVVITGALAPTVSIDGRDMSNLIFLQRMYDAGLGECFDVLSAQGYGLFSGPTDRRMRPMRINYAHHLWLRDIMVQNGDADKPIWLSEMNWNPVPTETQVPDIAGRRNYGQVTLEQQAAWIPLAYERAAEEWPWVGVVNFWFFKRARDVEQNQSWYYFRMVEPDFTPLPVYNAIREYIAENPHP